MFAVYWRTVLAIVLLILLYAFAQQQFDFLSIAGNTRYYPSFFWLLVSLSFFVSFAINRNGLVYLLFGKRLGLTKAFWCRLNIANGVFFAFLAVLAYLVYAIFNTQTWQGFKLFVQPGLLLVMPAVYTIYLFVVAGGRRKSTG